MGSLATIAQIKEFLNISSVTYDTFATNLLARASAFIEMQCSRVFAETEYKELYDGNGGCELFLDNYPIISLTKFSEDYDIATATINDDIDVATILLQKDTGLISPTDFTISKGIRNIYVEYKAGYATIPADVQQVCIELCARKFKESDVNPAGGRIGVTAKSVMSENVTFSFSDMSAMHKDILKAYKRTNLKRGYTVAA